MIKNAKKSFLMTILTILLGAVLAIAIPFSVRTRVAKASTYTPTVAITYANGTFTSSNSNFTVTANGTGITADEKIPGAWVFGATDAYLAVTPAEGKAFLTQTNGVTFTFNQRNLFTHIKMDGDESNKSEDAYPDPYEQLITLDTASGLQLAICQGAIYLKDGDAATTYVQDTVNHYGMLTDVAKQITIAVDFNNYVLTVYADGALLQQLSFENNAKKTAELTSSLDRMKELLSTPGYTLNLHKPFADKGGRNTTGLVMGDFRIHDQLFSSTDAATFFAENPVPGTTTPSEPEKPEEPAVPANPTLEVTYSNGAFSTNQTGYNVTVNGTGIVADQKVPGGWTYTNVDETGVTTDYLTLTAPADKAFLTQTKGATFTFLHRTAYTHEQMGGDSANSSLAGYPQQYEQYLAVFGEGGVEGSFCNGAFFYNNGSKLDFTQVKDDTDLAKYALMTDKTKLVTFVMDFENNTIQIYVNGILTQEYNESLNSNRVTQLKGIIELFKNALTANGGTIYVHRAVTDRDFRQTSGLTMGDFRIHDKLFTAEDAATFFAENPIPQPEEPDIPVEPELPDPEMPANPAGFTPALQIAYGNNKFITNNKNYTVTAPKEYIAPDTVIPGGYNFTTTSHYITVNATNGASFLTQTKGATFLFQHRTLVNHAEAGGLEADKNKDEYPDPYEQIVTIESPDGRSAAFCAGGMYYWDGANRSYVQSQSPHYGLLTSTPKQIAYVFDFENAEVRVYADGEFMYNYNEERNSGKVETIRGILSIFNEYLNSENSTLYIRKTFNDRDSKQTTGLVLGNFQLYDGVLTEEQIKDYQDFTLGNARVRFQANMAGVELPDFVAPLGTAFTLANIPTVTAYEYKGAYVDEAYNIPFVDGTLLNATMRIYLKYEPITYTINYHGATVDGNPTSYTVENDGITILDAVKAGYVFDGWYRTEAFENQVTFLVPGTYGDIDLYAKFTPIVYTITYVREGGVFTETPVENYTVEDADIVLASLWKAYYDFGGWFLDEALTEAVTEIDTALAQNVTVYAKFTPTVYTVTYVMNGGSTEETLVERYTVESNVITLPALAKSNYTFNGWFLDEALTEEVIEIGVADPDNITLYAKFTPNVYTVTYVMNGGTTEETLVENYTVEDENIALPTIAKHYYTFNGWFLDEALTEAVTEIDTALAQNVTVYAKFTPTVYTVTYVMNGGTTEETLVENYTVEDENIALPTIAKNYYTFNGWFLDEALTEAVAEIDTTLAQNVTVYAKFTPTVYTITYVMNGGTTEETLVENYTVEDENIALPTIAKHYYTFNGWFLDEALTEAVAEIDTTLAQNVTVYAKFTPTVYTITYVMNGGTTEVTLVENYTVESDTIVLPELTKEGYVFNGWYLDETLSNSVTEINAENPQNVTVYARFTKKVVSRGCIANVSSDMSVYCILTVALACFFTFKKRGEKK